MASNRDDSPTTSIREVKTAQDLAPRTIDFHIDDEALKQVPSRRGSRADTSTQNERNHSNSRQSRSRSRSRTRSLNSPPPPSAFVPRVGFDTFSNRDTKVFAYTLKSKHRDYRYRRSSRTFLVGIDTNEYSQCAIEWLIDVLADDGDEIVALRVTEEGEKMEKTTKEKVERYKEEAAKVMEEIIEMNDEDKEINIVVEFAVGKVQDMIQQMIMIYHPDSLIVGTRGRNSGLQSLLPGSISKYCLQHSPIPVVVVRPEYKRAKNKTKRAKDPQRQSYLTILHKQSSDSFASISPLVQASSPANPASASNTGISGQGAPTPNGGILARPSALNKSVSSIGDSEGNLSTSKVSFDPNRRHSAIS